MNKSDSIAALAGALAKAQAKMKNPTFDATNPHYRSKYATLAAVRDVVIPILSEHGLSVSQWPLFVEGHAGCRTFLAHDSGEWMEETLLIPVDKQNAHGAGSCITYARRFSLMALAGVVGDEDDDGNAAVEPKKQGRPKSDSPSPVSGPITPNGGAMDNVPPERREYVNRIASTIIDCFEAGTPEDAYKTYLTVTDHEEKLGVWSLLDSKQRRALKTMDQNARLAEQA